MTDRPLHHHPRRLLVTGGAGFIGANFVRYRLATYPDSRIVVLDALTYAGSLASLEPVKAQPGFRFVHGDIIDQPLVEQLLRDESIDTIVHFAAESHVDRSIHAPDAFVQTNVLGTLSLLNAARSVWLERGMAGCRFHHVSTDEVYGSLDPADPPFTESTAYAPNSPYSASKAASDHLVRAYHHTYGLDTTTSNCSNNYGPYQFPEKLIPLMVLNMLQGKPLPVYGDGLNVRDWLYAEDHCRGIDLILHYGRSGETYNIGGHCEKTNLEVVQALCTAMDELLPQSPHRPHHRLITRVKDRPGHDRRYAIDARKIAGELGYTPAESFSGGLQKTIRWYLDNPDWWQPLIENGYQDWITRQYG